MGQKRLRQVQGMGFKLGVEHENARLRPLLERCEARIRALRGSLRAEDMELLADLRRELGKE